MGGWVGGWLTVLDLPHHCMEDLLDLLEKVGRCLGGWWRRRRGFE